MKHETFSGAFPARLVIADDHEISRSGLRSMLESEPDLEIVGEAGDGKEAIEVCHRTQPDLLLMDVQMPRKNGLAAARELKCELPRTRVLIMTIYESPRYFSEALKAGAAGYVLKDAAKREVIGAVRSVLRGDPVTPPDLSARASEKTNDQSENSPKPPPEHMTPRELEILRHVAQGKTNREIAKSLMVSAGTVKVHVGHIISKLAVADRTEAAVRAIELGLLPTPE